VTAQPEQKTKPLGKGGRRKHDNFQVVLTYRDGDEFSRIYRDEAKAKGFAKRQKRSPIVKAARVVKL
jgi:hypothetical protein